MALKKTVMLYLIQVFIKNRLRVKAAMTDIKGLSINSFIAFIGMINASDTANLKG